MDTGLFETLWMHDRLPCPSPTPRACSNSFPSSRWCHPTISFSVVPFSYLQSFPASESLPMSPFFASGGQSIGDSASASVLPMNSHGWFPLGLTGLIALQSKGLSRVFSSTSECYLGSNTDLQNDDWRFKYIQWWFLALIMDLGVNLFISEYNTILFETIWYVFKSRDLE